MTDATVSAPQTRWFIVGLAVGCGVLGAFQIGKVPVSLSALRADLGLGLVAAGWVISMFSVISVAGGMSMGVAVGRFGDRRTVLCGLDCLAGASAFGAVASSAAMILVSRFFEGLGFLMVQVSAPSLIQRYATPADQRLSFGLFGAYMGTGQFIIMLLSPLALAAIGWRGLWLANAAVIVIFAAVLAVATRAPSVVEPLPRPAGTHGIWRDMRDTVFAAGPVTLAFCFSTYALNYLVVVGFLPTILVDELRLSSTAAAVLTAVAVLTNACGNVAGGILLQRGVPRWKLIVVSHVAMGLTSLGVFSEALPLSARFALCLVFMGIGGILPPAVFSGATRYAPAPHLIATTNGIIVQGSAIGQVMGPPAAAAIATATGGWAWSPVLLAPGAVFGIALALYLRRLDNAPAVRRAPQI